MTRDPYRLPDRACAIHVSGGRTSGYLLQRIVVAHGGVLPPQAYALFANTGREDPRTLDFVRDLGAHLGVHIHWLEYEYAPAARGGPRDPRHRHRVVDHATASRDGRPFDDLLAQGRLPSTLTRSCTSNLKIRTMARHMRRHLGIREWHSVLGFRADEPQRAANLIRRGCRDRPGRLPELFPLIAAGVTKADVRRHWQAQTFDLQTPPELGNCDLCFMKGIRQRVRAARANPDAVQWWAAHEARSQARGRMRDPRMAQWDRRHSIAEIAERARQGDLFRPDDGAEADADAPCHCTD